ncbi:uncharacterized protein CIMG_13737 [Coccidioides immitis RS]|uniref:Uncharacterized protein n=1 Tax=Coccidioides immitis (strain RS) TaxID=246410 RepID=A0A0D8JW64_COCIM|nr:uncharacterized protein CIMG_13737 [Coccidioides immitis RS]KJF61557.1 hypothetical protein CIMG_13737 [Coccidioides immitis RS]
MPLLMYSSKRCKIDALRDAPLKRDALAFLKAKIVQQQSTITELTEIAFKQQSTINELTMINSRQLSTITELTATAIQQLTDHAPSGEAGSNNLSLTHGGQPQAGGGPIKDTLPSKNMKAEAGKELSCRPEFWFGARLDSFNLEAEDPWFNATFDNFDCKATVNGQKA